MGQIGLSVSLWSKLMQKTDKNIKFRPKTSTQFGLSHFPCSDSELLMNQDQTECQSLVIFRTKNRQKPQKRPKTNTQSDLLPKSHCKKPTKNSKNDRVKPILAPKTAKKPKKRALFGPNPPSPRKNRPKTWSFLTKSKSPKWRKSSSILNSDRCKGILKMT